MEDPSVYQSHTGNEAIESKSAARLGMRARLAFGLTDSPQARGYAIVFKTVFTNNRRLNADCDCDPLQAVLWSALCWMDVRYIFV